MQALPQLLWQLGIKSIIDFSPLTVKPQTSVSDAIALMANHGVSVLVVSVSQVVGWLTQKDVVQLLAAGIDFQTTQISEVMHTSVITLNYAEFENIATVISLLRQNQLDLLPVVDEQSQLVGIVTPASICRGLAETTMETRGEYSQTPAERLRILESAVVNANDTIITTKATELQQANPDLEMCGAEGIQAFTQVNQQLVLEMAERQIIEERFRFLAESIPQYAWIANTNGELEYLNQRALDYFACTPEQVLGIKWQQWIHPEDMSNCLSCWHKSLATGEPYEIEFRALGGTDKTYHWHLVRALPLRNQQGKIINWFGTNTVIDDRVSAEIALRETQQQLQAIIDNSPAAIYLVDIEGKNLLVNRQYEKVLNFTRKQIIGKNLSDLWPGDFADKFTANNNQVIANGISIQTEETVPQKDGLHTYLSIKFPLKDDNGVPYAVGGISTDITERKLAEESLLRFRKAIESTSDAVAIGDITGAAIYVNPAFIELYDYKLEDLQTVDGEAIVYKYLTDYQRIHNTIISGQSWRGEVTMQAGNGRIVQAYLRSDAIKDATGKIVGTVCIHTDITQQKRAEEGLRLRDRAIAASSNGIIIVDATIIYRPIIYVNPAFERMTGYCAAEVIGQNFDSFQSADINQSGLQELNAAMQAGRDCTITICNYRKDGSLLWNELNVSPVYDVAGKLTHYIGIQTDITKRKQLEEELKVALEKEKELNELKSRFVAMTSHEFRTPLSTILSSSELLEHYRHKWTEEKQLTHLHRIQNAVERMSEMLNDVLVIGKAEAGRLEFRPKSFDLVEYCRCFLEELQLNQSNGCVIYFTSKHQFISCCMDDKLLGHILNNLLSNAIKYSPNESAVKFTLVCQDEQVVFEIQDQGIGIPEEDIPHLFETFHRARNVGNILGTGLGLAIVKKCVELHQGKIAVTSQLGVGTAFTVTLPLNNHLETEVGND